MSRPKGPGKARKARTATTPRRAARAAGKQAKRALKPALKPSIKAAKTKSSTRMAASNREIAALKRALRAADRQQAATAETLTLISRSAFDLQQVLDALTVSAARLCHADMAALTRADEAGFQHVTNYNFPPDWIQFNETTRLTPGRGSIVGRALLEKKTVHVDDVLADPEYTYLEPQRKAGYRTCLGVPLWRDAQPIGVFFLCRRTVRRFTEQEIGLVTTFADQAVIAIENARLFDEVRARTRSLAESLERQTATSDVLGVISRSTYQVQPVFDAIVKTASRLCEAEFALIFQLRDGLYHPVASNNATDALVKYAAEHPVAPGRGSLVGRAAIERKTVHLHDCLADPEYTLREYQRVAKFRTMLGVPLMHEGVAVGVIGLLRPVVKPFAETQIELVSTFADQAVIAIENARLFEELQARTADLSESLQQQTATADVLKVISRSAFDLESVLQTLVESAARLCDAEKATITRQRDGVFYREEAYGFSAEFIAYVKDIPVVPERGSATGRALLEGRVVHIADVLADPEYSFGEAQKLGGFRTILGVPMMREGVAIGVLALTRAEVRPFTDKQIELVSTFADQAAIAIENVRLFESVQARTRELTEALEQQTATSAILNVISGSPTDTQPVFAAIVDSGAKLFPHAAISIALPQGDTIVAAAVAESDAARATAWRGVFPFPLARGYMHGAAILDGRVIDIPDVADAPPEFAAGGRNFLASGYRAITIMPMMRGGAAIGALSVVRLAPGPLSDKQRAILKTFADQAVIAIENARLFANLEARTHELARSLEELRAAQDRLVQTEKLASLGQLTAGIAHEIKNPLNFINNFAALSGELIGELEDHLRDAPLSAAARAEVDEVASLLRGNLDKVVEHGKRADSIVKNMLLHSRAGKGEHRPVEINGIVEESLNLAYHGARAEKPGFNVTIERSFDPAAGAADLYPQEITRVLLNLISNAFHATSKRKAEASGDYEPRLLAATRDLGERVEIRIRDNGTGIPPEVRDKIFDPFFTTKPAGEGTGLGLSLSHDIVVKQHGGAIELATAPGEFTEFRILLPRDGARP